MRASVTVVAATLLLGVVMTTPEVGQAQSTGQLPYQLVPRLLLTQGEYTLERTEWDYVDGSIQVDTSQVLFAKITPDSVSFLLKTGSRGILYHRGTYIGFDRLGVFGRALLDWHTAFIRSSPRLHTPLMSSGRSMLSNLNRADAVVQPFDTAVNGQPLRGLEVQIAQPTEDTDLRQLHVRYLLDASGMPSEYTQWLTVPLGTTCVRHRLLKLREEPRAELLTRLDSAYAQLSTMRSSTARTSERGTKSSSLLQVGSSLANLACINAHGDTVTLRSLTRKRVLLHFWMAHCEPCFRLVRFLEELHVDTSRWEILDVNPIDSREVAEKIRRSSKLEEHQMKLMDPAISIDAYPTTLLLDEDKRVYSVLTGFSECTRNELTSQLGNPTQFR